MHLGYVLVSVVLLPLLVGRGDGRALDSDAGAGRMGFLVIALACAVGVVVARMRATWS